MSESEILTATEASRSFSDMLHRVCYNGESFVIKKGNRLMARIVPVSPQHEPEVVAAAAAPAPAIKPAALSENQILKSLLGEPTPSANLTHDEVEYFQAMLEELRQPALAD
jgi:antitoxin (DNA-binding transcriptional repressor) of toxin-antitoxin stability system